MQTERLNLSTLLNHDKIVIVNHHDKISGRTLLAYITHIHHQLFRTDHQQIALCFDDSLRFIIALFATLTAGRTPVLLPNNQLGTINEFKSTYDAILTDQEIELTQTECDTRLEINITHQIDIFTSGSTDKPKKVTRPIDCLLYEIDALEKQFGDRMNNSTVYATVSHQHIYGLIFFIFWPLLKERTVILPRLQFPEQIVSLLRQKKPAVLISNPTLLTRSFYEEILTDQLTIFSSGSLLHHREALAIKHFIGVSPIEIYGSTETSGIAFRQQINQNDARWHTLPSVELGIDHGCLTVSSPFFCDKKPFITHDQVELFNDGSFILKGRADRIVKIEGKRASLPEIEAKLHGHPFVSACAIIAISDQRDYLAAIIILNKDGERALKTESKHHLNKQFKNYLSQFYDTVLLPKRFRYVSEIPSNEQGKRTRAALLKLFE